MTETLQWAPEAATAHPAPMLVAVRAFGLGGHRALLEQLRFRRELRLVAAEHPAATALLACADRVDEHLLHLVRSASDRGLRVVVAVARHDTAARSTLLAAGAAAVLPRLAATPDRLVAVLREVQPRPALAPTSLSGRERDVLDLLADGLSTREVALRLCYSERTIKHVLQELSVRLGLRNRTQIVAYAIRNGWI